MELIYSISGWLFLLLGLAISIGLHELGHLWPAKKFGVKVTKYMIGFGPTLFSRKRGDTEYGVKAIPLGGYIQMVGMMPPTTSDRKNLWQRLTAFAQPLEHPAVAPEDEDKTFYKLAPWKKLIIMFSGPFANLLIALVLALVLFSGFGSYEQNTKINSIVACVPTDANPNCDAQGEDSPAKVAGLKAGDQILEFNGASVRYWSEVVPLLKEAVGSSASILVLRQGEEIQLSISPVNLTLGGQTRPYLGVYLEAERVQKSPGDAIGIVGSMLAATGNMILQLPVQSIQAVSEIVPGSPRNSEGVISIVGLGQFSGQIAADSSISLEDKLLSELGMLMSLNIALFVFNMVPLVPLDGGHMAGGIYEWIKRGIWRIRGKKLDKPVDTGQMMPIAYVVGILLLVLTLILVIRDITNPLQL